MTIYELHTLKRNANVNRHFFSVCFKSSYCLYFSYCLKEDIGENIGTSTFWFYYNTKIIKKASASTAYIVTSRDANILLVLISK